MSLLSDLYPPDEYPKQLSIFLTTRCNLKCFVCNRDGYKGIDLKFENIYKLANAIKYAKKVDLTGWGECFLYPRFEDVLDYIYSQNSKEDLIFITTNGTRLTKHIASLLRGRLYLFVISLNAATPETYNRDMQNGNFEKTLSTIQTFLSELRQDDRSKIELHFVAHAENFREIPDFVALAYKLGIPAVSVGNYLISRIERFKYSLIHVSEEYNDIIDKSRELGGKLGVSVAGRKFFTEIKKECSQEKCRSPFDECFIEPDGKVKSCCFVGNKSMGNAYETSFEDVWFGEEYLKLRETRYLPACQKCVPFIPFDDYAAHFTADIKKTDVFKRYEAADAFNREGVDLLNAGNMDGARAAFLRSVEQNVEFTTAHNNLGLISCHQGKYVDAIRHFAKALQLEPSNLMIMENIEKTYEILRASK